MKRLLALSLVLGLGLLVGGTVSGAVGTAKGARGALSLRPAGHGGTDVSASQGAQRQQVARSVAQLGCSLIGVVISLVAGVALLAVRGWERRVESQKRL